MNRDDAVKALDAALTNMQKGGRYTPEDVDDLERCARNVLDLLKAQEPKRVSVVNNGFTGLPVTHCPKCHRPIDMFYGAHGAETEFCPWCGQAVKWE